MSSVSKGVIDLATGDVTGTLPVTNGGTGVATTTQGDILYADASNSIAKLAKNTTATRVLTNTGTSNNPAWAQVALATGVSGVLPEANGGTNQSTFAQGDILYASAANTLSKLAKDTGSTRVLTNTGASNNPAWAQLDLTTGATAAPTDWTPTISVPTGSIGAPTITYAKYTKIGRLVFIQVRLLATISAGSPAYISITNLPFTSASLGASQRMYGFVNTAGGSESGNFSILDNSTELQIYRAAFAAFTTSASNGTNTDFYYLAAS